MERAVLHTALLGLLLALVSTLPIKDDWNIYSFHINSTVSGRYATTVITSRVANRMNDSKEIEFQVRIPKNAFITQFRMFIDGEAYDGVVKAKETAQQQYTEAVTRGQSAGLVSSVGRTLEEFKTSVTVAAHKKITFELTYEELLTRRHGKYNLIIHARPMQLVKDFKIDVHINEKAGITFMEVKGGLSTNALADVITKNHTDKEASLSFYPTEDQQKLCDSCGEHGLNGDLVITYDVNRDTSFGDIKKSPGYFVHHFAPSNLPRISKNVVFVIDQSGSMSGKKMKQTRIALVHILSDLSEDDHFGLITFDSSIFHWKRELVQANAENLQSAITFARGIQDRGATDINKAVLEGTRMLNVHPREGSASILILLTDGDPTSGVTNREAIQSNVARAIAGKFPLYCLGFGFDVDLEFLEKMSLQNSGVARRIYEDSDADLQLKGFYEEVATPLLTDVSMIYIGGSNLTKTNYSQYYNGSEIVVAGQITDNNIETFTPQVVAISMNRKLTFSETKTPTEFTDTMSDSHIQRIWAYLTVKQLLEKELLLSGAEKENVKKEALELSLKYSFVTPLTSMVVTKPPGEKTDVLHKPKETSQSAQDTQGYLFNSHVQHSQPGPTMYGSSGVGSGSGRTLAKGYGSSGVGIGVGSGFHRTMSRGSSGRRFGGRFSAPPAQAPPDYTMFGQSSPDFLMVGHSPPALSLPRGNPPAHSPPAYNYDVQHYMPRATVTSAPATKVPTTRAPLFHRLLRKSVNQSLPLCFDMSGDHPLKLLGYPGEELSVLGRLDSLESGSFQTIILKQGNHTDVNITVHQASVRDGKKVSFHVAPDTITVGSLTIIRRLDEVEVVAGDMNLLISNHVKDGKYFQWPSLRQQPSGDDATGLLVLRPVVYEEVQQSPATKVKINDQEIDVTRSHVLDHSMRLSPSIACWLMSADSALQTSLDDFIVAD